MNESTIEDKLAAMEGIRFYYVVKISAEKRLKGEDPKYSDKRIFSMELGGIATDVEDQEEKAKNAVEFLIEKEKKVLLGEKNADSM